jgi:hypothetical protein
VLRKAEAFLILKKEDTMKKIALILVLAVFAAVPSVWAEQNQDCPEGQTWDKATSVCIADSGAGATGASDAGAGTTGM